MKTAEEIELKLQVADAADWEAICACVCARGRAAAPAEMEAVYFDTPEADLRRARLAYRVRREGAQWVATLKGGGSSQGGLHCRSEWNRPAAGAEPDLAQFADVLGEQAALAGKALHPIVRTAFVREAVLVECGGSLLEAALDRGLIEAGGRSAPILEVELELKRGSVQAALAFGAQLARHFPFVLEARSKFLRGLLLAGLAQEERPPALAPASALEAAQALAAHLCDAWRAGEAADARFCLPHVAFLARKDWAAPQLKAQLRQWQEALARGEAENRQALAILLSVWEACV